MWLRCQVGVDVPEASVIVVEGADRFGLAALHQLRGRVGRGTRASACYLVSSSEASERLAILEHSHNGFRIAEADLIHRWYFCGKPVLPYPDNCPLTPDHAIALAQ